jgi:hypothetical protein
MLATGFRIIMDISKIQHKESRIEDSLSSTKDLTLLNYASINGTNRENTSAGEDG